MRDEEAALDIVQDAMLRLAEKYGDRPAEELPLLFHRIVQNAIRDWYRRQKVRALWVTPFAALLGLMSSVPEHKGWTQFLRPTFVIYKTAESSG